MELALVNGLRQTPTPRQVGICEYCGSEMVAKCGRIKLWHWAHKRRSNCDPWWESESEWHRAWKHHFPINWHEVIHRDPLTDEKHIADVKTPYGLTIEFQNSAISFQERQSREDFYKNMVWVINGDTQPDGWYGRLFSTGLSKSPICFDPLTYGVQWRAQNRFLLNWAESDVEVYLDFGQTEGIMDSLWRLVSFEPDYRVYIVQPLRREWFIESCIGGEKIPSGFVEEKDRHNYHRKMVHINTIDGRT